MDDAARSPAERRLIADLTALVVRYYPVWVPERESVDDYFARLYDAPETKRLETLIRRRIERDRNRWRACLNDIRAALVRAGRGLSVRDGNPPMFYIPSLQVVVTGAHARGEVTMVFRLSMLAPLYDYYERVRDSTAQVEDLRLAPSDETVAIADAVRTVIATHFADYRELPPDIGAVSVPNVVTIDPSMKAETGSSVVEYTLAELLFENTRRW